MQIDESATAREILEVIPVVMQAIRVEVRKHRGADLSVPQLRAMTHLRRKPGASLADVAEHIGLTASTASGLIDGLVERGYVARIEAAGDRRRVELRLTPSGLDLLETALEGARGALARRLAGLPAEELEQVYGALQILRPLFGIEPALSETGRGPHDTYHI